MVVLIPVRGGSTSSNGCIYGSTYYVAIYNLVVLITSPLISTYYGSTYSCDPFQISEMLPRNNAAMYATRHVAGSQLAKTIIVDVCN
jgi:hypothetical protein